MITTVTLNPAIDLFLETEEILYDEVLRSTASSRSAGGKGLNVSRMLHALGEPTHALVLVGGSTGQEYVHLGKRDGFDVVPIETSAPTRINVVIKDTGTGRHIKVNMPGEEMDHRYLPSVKRHLERHMPESRALVLAGSLAPGFPIHAYVDLIRTARQKGVPTFVDTTGKPLARVLPEKPDVVKVNRTEMEETLERPLPDRASVVRMAQQYVRGGIGIFCVTDGPRGAVMVDETGAWVCDPPRLSEERAVGAGDCFMAGLVSSALQGNRGPDLLAFALACGTAWALHRDTDEPITRDQVERLAAETKVEEFGG